MALLPNYLGTQNRDTLTVYTFVNCSDIVGPRSAVAVVILTHQILRTRRYRASVKGAIEKGTVCHHRLAQPSNTY